MEQTAHQGWIASLSNGQTIFEYPPSVGEPSSWQQLLTWCRETGVVITMMRLQRGVTTLHALSKKQVDGYYQAYEISKNLNTGGTKTRQGIGSVIGEQVFISWIDEDGHVWQDIRPLSSEKVHTTLA